MSDAQPPDDAEAELTYFAAKARGTAIGDRHDARAAQFLATLNWEQMRELAQIVQARDFSRINPDFLAACVHVQLHLESMRRIELAKPQD